MAIRSKEDLKEYISRRLGAGTVCVELTDDHLDDAVTVAEEWWQMWVGVTKAVLITLTDGTEYPASSIATDIDSVVDVIFELYDDGLEKIFDWAGVEINPYTYVYGGGGDYGALVQYMQYREMGKRIVSADRDWEWFEEEQKLIISPRTTGGEKAVVIYLSTQMDYNRLATYEWLLFRNYALATAMKTLAIIRMKFSDKPSATGGFSMDGDALWANAEALEMASEEKMRNMQHPVAFWAE